MDFAGPGSTYLKKPYIERPGKRSRLAAAVSIEGIDGIEGRARRPLRAVGRRPASSGGLALPSIRHPRPSISVTRRAVAALAAFVGFFSISNAQTESSRPPVTLVPPVRSAPPPATRSLLLDAYVLGSSIFAVGERGALIRSDDSGQNWEAIEVSVAATFTGITFADTHRGWIVGHEGSILMTNDGGLSWSPSTLKDATDVSLLDVLATDIHHALAVGGFGACLITADAGHTWTPRKVINEDVHLNRLTRGRGTEFFLAGERGTLLRFAEFRAEPERLATGYEGSFNGVILLAERRLLAYGLRGHVFRSEDNGTTWSAVAGLPPVLLSTALKTKSGLIVLAGQARVFLVSRDDGQTFSSWNTPITTAVAKIVEAPDGSLLTFGESGVNRLRPPPPPSESTARPEPPVGRP